MLRGAAANLAAWLSLVVRPRALPGEPAAAADAAARARRHRRHRAGRRRDGVHRRARRHVRARRCRPGWSTPSTRSRTTAGPAGSSFRSPGLIIAGGRLRPDRGAYRQSGAGQPGDAAALSVSGDRAARSCRHGHQGPDRPRAPLGLPGRSHTSRGRGNTNTRACRPGTRPPPSRRRWRSRALWPRTRIPLLIFAVVIAVSRVVITAHFVSDVVAAAFVGALRRDPGAQLVCGARARFSCRRPTVPCTCARARPGAASRRLPGR